MLDHQAVLRACEGPAVGAFRLDDQVKIEAVDERADPVDGRLGEVGGAVPGVGGLVGSPNFRA